MSANGIKIDAAELVGIICEGVFYGLFVGMFVGTVHVLTVGRLRHSTINVPMLGAAFLMMGLATAQLAVDSVNIFTAFIRKGDVGRAGRNAHLLDVTQPIFAAKHAIYFTMMFVGDAIVIWRAYIIWARRWWVVVLPTLCSLGSAAAAYQTIWSVRHSATLTTTISSAAAWGYAIFSLSLGANTISTGLIIYPIWKHDRSLHKTLNGSVGTSTRTGKSTLMPVVRIILESGVINAAYLLAYTIVLSSGSHGLEIMASISTPLIGIIFAIVIIRAGIARQLEQTTAVASSSSMSMPVVINRSKSTAVVVHDADTWDTAHTESASKVKDSI